MKHIVKVFALMLLLIATQQKAFSQTELKIHEGTVNPICKDSTKAPKDLMSFAIAVKDNTVVNFFQPGVSNVDWANKVCEGFNYRAATRLAMEPITINMLVKMLKDTAHCHIKYLNVKKGLLLNSGVDPATSNIVWVEMKNDITAEPYIVYTSPYNGQEAVLARWICRCNPQADLREAIPEEKLADNNDDIYYTPDKNEGISDATAHADATANATVNVNYIPQGATNYQQYNQQCGCMQQYYPPQQQYCYTPSYNSGLFVGVQILFTFQWGGQTYNAYDPNDQIVQNIVNNYVTNNYIVNNYGTSDSTSVTDTGGPKDGEGGDTDTGGNTDGTGGIADTGGNIDGHGKNANPNDHVVETLDANPVASNAHMNQTHQASNLDGSGIASNVGNSIHNAQTLGANPGLVNVNGVDHQVTTLGNTATLAGTNSISNGFNNSVETLNANPAFANVNPTYNGVNNTVTNLDENPMLANNSGNQNVFYSGNSQSGQMNVNQQSANNNVYTASANNGTFNPQANSQGVQTYSNDSQLQTTYTNPQGQTYGQYGTVPVSGNNQNVVNGTYPNYNVPAVNNSNTIGTTGNTNGYVNSTPRGNISYNPQQGNLQQLQSNSSGNNFNTGNFGNNLGTASSPVRNLNLSPAPKFNLAPSVQKGSLIGTRTF